MKLLTIVILTLVTLTAILFAVLNTESVNLNYYYGKSELPLSLLIVISLSIGALLGVLTCFSIIVRVKRENSSMKKDIKLIEEEVSNLRRLPLRDIN